MRAAAQVPRRRRAGARVTRAAPPAPSASPARACALAVVRRVFEDGAWADRALHGEARRLGLGPRDRALAMRLAYGTVQRRATLDHVAQALAGRPPDRLQPPALPPPPPRPPPPAARAPAARPPARLEPLVLAALRLGLYQLTFLDRIPAHAAVSESVALVKPQSPGGAKLVNAVLRRAVREARARVEALPERTPA